MSQTLKKTVSLTANEALTNQLSDSGFAILPYAAYVSMWATEKAADVEVDLEATGQVLLKKAQPNVNTTVGVVDLQADQIMPRTLIQAGVSLLLDFTDTSGAANSISYIIVIERFYGQP